MAEEGLRGILGVPLRVGKEVIGVLFAGNRFPRDFTPDAIALLGSLADHAAVAIDSARLLEETRSALARLEAANATARAHSEALRRASDAHDRLTRLVLRGAGVDDMAAEIASLLGGEVAVHDIDGSELARTGGEPAAPRAEDLAASRADGRAVRADGVWTCAVLAGAEPLGGIVLTGRGDLSEADRRLFERAALVTAMLLMMRRSVAETEDRIRGELLDDLLAGPASSVHWDGAATPSGPGASASTWPGPTPSPSSTARRPRAPGSPRRPPVPPAGSAAWRAPGTAAPSCWRRANGPAPSPAVSPPISPAPSAPPSPSARPAPGTARRSTPPSTPRRCAASRRSTPSAAPGTGPTPPTSASSGSCSATGPTSARTSNGSSVPSSPTTRSAAPNCCAPCTPTTTGASLSRAKESLHVHVNTVVQRLDRVARLLGPDWNSPARALEIQLALRLHRLVHAPGR